MSVAEPLPDVVLPGEPFTLEHFRAWAGRLTLDSDEPWQLEPFQERFVADLFAGYRVCWLVVPEGNGKTTTIAGLALYHIEFTPSAYVAVAASARDQAEWIYRQAEGFVFRSGLRGFKCLEGYRRIRFDSAYSRMQVFAADDRSGDGIIPTLAILDELHRHRSLDLYRTWVGKLRKRGGQLIVISTAGEVGGEFEEERVRIRQSGSGEERDRGFVRVEQIFDSKRLSVLHEYAVPEDGDVDDLELVAAANPHPGVTVASLEEKRQLPGMTPQHWSRFTCNLAARSASAAVTEAEWFGARSSDPIPEGAPISLGLDLAFRIDTTSAVPLWWRDNEFRLFGPARILVPPRNGDSLDPALVEQMLRDIHARNPIDTVVMDPSKAEQLAKWIRDELGCQVIERSQTNAFAVMDYARFMEALRLGWLKHSGDEGLSRHVLNAVARLLPGGDTRFERSSDSRRSARLQGQRVIDALTAAAMVHSFEVGERDQPPIEPMIGFG